MSKTKVHSDKLGVRGFFRVQISEDGKGVVGDSGWRENQVTNLGIRQYIVDWLCSGAGKSVRYMTLGTGTVPNASATHLDGELTQASNCRVVVNSSISNSGTAVFTGAFASSNSFITTTVTIANIGLFDASLTNAGTLFAGNTFTASSCAVNQSVNATYQIRFTSV